MEEEIKETFNIEELFDEWKQFLSWCYENNDKTVEIHRDKLKWTIDYITNLQCDIDSYKTKYNNAKNNLKILQEEVNKLTAESTEWESKCYDLQEENTKLKQPQIFIDTMDMEERYGQQLYEDYLEEQLEDYKSRNEKAIEYVEKNKHIIRFDKLKNILQGEDK